MIVDKLLGRTICVGSWCQVGHPANAEILARSGFEWLAADCEHGEIEDGDLGNFCRAVRQHAVAPLVRVRENAPLPIRRALDLGAAGVIVPLVNDAAGARRAVAASNYPPTGIRGFAWQRGNHWGADFDTYAAEFRPVVVVMIESREAVEHAEAIAAVDGIHACLVGPYDLSGSYGIPGQTNHTLVHDACRRVSEACARRGKSAGLHLVAPNRENVHGAIEQGYTFLALGMDTHFLAQGASSARGLLP